MTTSMKLYTLLSFHQMRVTCSLALSQNPVPRSQRAAIGTNLSMHLLIHTYSDTDGLLTRIDVSEQQVSYRSFTRHEMLWES